MLSSRFLSKYTFYVSNYTFSVLPSTGFEPARISHMILNHKCLPFHHEGIRFLCRIEFLVSFPKNSINN